MALVSKDFMILHNDSRAVQHACILSGLFWLSQVEFTSCNNVTKSHHFHKYIFHCLHMYFSWTCFGTPLRSLDSKASAFSCALLIFWCKWDAEIPHSLHENVMM